MNYKKWKSVKNAHKREVLEYAIELNLYKRENKHLLSALSLVRADNNQMFAEIVDLKLRCTRQAGAINII